MKSIRELLTDRSLIALPGSASALDAARKMKDCRVGALLVVDAQGGPLGIFTERDLMTRVVVESRSPESVQIKEVMSRDLFTASPERRINEVAREMQERHIRHLPVVEEGRVIGMLSLRDLLREHLQAKRSEVEALTSYIKGTETGS